MKQYAMYKGDDLLGIGTAVELGKLLDIEPRTVRWYATPSWRKRVDRSPDPDAQIIAIKIDEKDEEGIDE